MNTSARSVDDVRALPALAPPPRSSLVFWFVGITTAGVGLAILAQRIAAHADLWHWSTALAALGGVVAADFLSGIVHWAADTWGHEDMPVVGQRVLVPFRVHHLNPDDFLRRRFLDTNGDVAWITTPLLLACCLLPLETTWESLIAVFGFGLCLSGVMTNQIHQWAHMPSPPAAVRILQNCGVLLGRREHAGHHAGPYDQNYCITTGWCNPLLDRVGFYRHLEAIITWLTGARPRVDDDRYVITFQQSL